MKRRRKGGGGANWQDTYGDMVTLLLCFFVLLYSMSTINETKWAMIVQSFKRETTRLVRELVRRMMKRIPTRFRSRT